MHPEDTRQHYVVVSAKLGDIESPFIPESYRTMLSTFTSQAQLGPLRLVATLHLRNPNHYSIKPEVSLMVVQVCVHWINTVVSEYLIYFDIFGTQCFHCSGQDNRRN